LVSAFCDLVLYSITFNNDRDLDLATLEAYARFRSDARAAGLRHILEVFNPNAPVGLSGQDVGAFINDSIVRTLAGLTSTERPLFLKVAFNGPDELEELVSYDPGLVVGVLGGAAGTTRDTFELLAQAERHGARVALFGRKIQQAESQSDLVRLMRSVLRRDLSPEQAVQSYHQSLNGQALIARRTLEEDLAITDPVLSQG
jgi:DhnA family fructose-bisphosphate aldolase class Ia